MAQTAFEQWIAFAEQIGVFQYVLPFLLTFTILFTILDNAGPFADKSRNNALISVVVALFVITFSPQGVALGTFLSNFFGAIAVALIALLVLMMGFSLIFGEDVRDRASGWLQLVAGLGIVIVVIVFLGQGGLSIIVPEGTYQGWNVMQQLGSVVGILLVLGAVAFLYWSLGSEG